MNKHTAGVFLAEGLLNKTCTDKHLFLLLKGFPYKDERGIQDEKHF
jgi:hypothetical protein